MTREEAEQLRAQRGFPSPGPTALPVDVGRGSTDRLRLLTSLLGDAEVVAEVYRHVHRLPAPVPGTPSAALVWHLLQRAGFRVSYNPIPALQAVLLQMQGWMVVDATQDPNPGDLFVCADEGTVTHLGFVLKRGAFRAGWIVAVDSTMPELRAYRRIIAGADLTPVAYWLRSGGG